MPAGDSREGFLGEEGCWVGALLELDPKRPVQFAWAAAKGGYSS